MKATEFGNQAFADFLQEEGNYGKWAFFPVKSSRMLALMKTAYDDRFSILMGNEFYLNRKDLKEDMDDQEHILDTLYGSVGSKGVVTLGLYDARTGSVYAHASELTRPFFGDRAWNLLETPSETIAPLLRAVAERATAYMNDPANHDALAAAWREDNPRHTEPYIDSDDLYSRHVNGVALEDVQDDLPVLSSEDLPLQEHPIRLAIRYLSDPQSAEDALFESMVNDPEIRNKMGGRILHHDALVSSYADFLERSEKNPEAIAEKNVLGALKNAFGDDVAGNLWITVARDARSVQFQYPMEQLLRQAARDTNSNVFFAMHIPSTEQREAYVRAMGTRSHSSHSFSIAAREPRLGFADISDITYRKRSLYAMDPHELAQRMETKEVEVGFYKADDSLRETMFERREHTYRLNHTRFAEGFDGSQTSEADFDHALTATVTVAAHADENTVFSQAYEQINSIAWEELKHGVRVGDALSVEGRTRLVGDYCDFDDLPFSLPAQGKEKVPVPKEEPVSLGSEARAMQSAKEVLESRPARQDSQHDAR